MEKQNKKTKKEYLKDALNIFRAMKRMLGYTFKISPFFAGGLFIAEALTAVFPFVQAWISSQILDELINVITQDNFATQVVVYYISVYVGFLLVRSIVGTIRSYLNVNLYFNISREFGHMMTKKFAYLDIEYYEDPETNDLLQKVRENFSHRPQEFSRLAYALLDNITAIVSGALILLAYSPILVLILVVTTAPQFVNNIVFGKRSWGIWGAKGEVKRDYWSSRNKLVSESSLMELRVFKARPYLLDRIYDLFYTFQKEQIKVENKRALTRLVLDLVNVAGFAVLFVLLVLDVIAKAISIGQFNFFVSTSRNLRSSIGHFFSNLARIYEYGLYMIDIFDVLEFKEKIVTGTKSLENNGTPPKIEFKDVAFKYPGTERWILEKFNLTIEPHEHIAIVGENGAGKTTLIKLLMRFYDVTDGEILLDGINIKDIDLESLYQKVGTLFQEFNTYHFDAKTNIGIGNVEKLSEHDRIEYSAKQSGAHAFISKYDDGYEQVLSKAFKGGINPSWGQWQKIALARAFFKDAPILILDEPTSAIDPKAEYEIFEKLFDFAKNKSVIIISHRFSTVRNATRILVLDNGKIIEQGTHQDLMEIDGGKYKVAFELQRKGYE